MSDRLMTGSVRVGKVLFDTHQADELNLALTPTQVAYLKDKGVLIGADWTGRKEPVAPATEDDTPPPPPPKPLPAGFPMRTVLIDAGITTLEKLAQTPDAQLLKIDGMGVATVEKIRQAAEA